ncbi:MG_279/MG_280 family protein [Mycoplasma bradburyae]|uniref:MG_279/MG_280 family protein n=1 Tax=Mycoplasma bradburyae TaxID=2963128 RepID=A0ABT5GAS4_9MOLU|nr:MG_279/MG_280 family protein [Mycoplasma bradburyae]MDC4181670.1 MG_279/MG_280 family protein [Mycoplasma bradburyae]UTS69908.1 MG_279/MG_280 family protein [Mycoplasma bradburyae]
MLNFFNKTIKRIIYSIGLIFILVLGGVGTAGYIFKEQISQFYEGFQDRNNGLLSQAKDVLNRVNEIVTNQDILTIPMKINNTVDTVGGGLNNFKGIIDETKHNIANVDTSIDEIRNKLKKYENVFTLTNSRSDYDETMMKLNEFQRIARNLSDTVIPESNKILSNVESGFDEAKRLAKVIDISELAEEVSKTITPITNIVDKLVILNKEATAEKFTHYLNLVSLSLMGVSGGLLALSILSLILRSMFYKSIKGYVVKRSRAVDQLSDFFSEACRIYPELKSELGIDEE